MNKKTLVSLLAVLLTSIYPAQAQQRGKVSRIGVLKTGTPPDANVDAFRQGLRELGYVEGQDCHP
jgi:hypothetical protein